MIKQYNKVTLCIYFKYFIAIKKLLHMYFKVIIVHIPKAE